VGQKRRQRWWVISRWLRGIITWWVPWRIWWQRWLQRGVISWRLKRWVSWWQTLITLIN
jgi:hypothetical protein